MIPCLFTPINLPKGSSLLQRSLLVATTFDFFPFSPMESFALLKFWKPATARVAGYGESVASNVAAADCLVPPPYSGEEEEESFFELEFTLPDYDHHVDCKDEQIDQKIGRIGDFISDEKADARISAKPQSPMSILRQSAPKLRVFMFGKLIKNSKPAKSQSVSDVDSTVPKRKTKINFTVKLRIEDTVAKKKKFSRSDSSRIIERRSSSGAGDRDLDGSCRRFSKDSVHKYLNLIKKPLYVKLSSTNSNSKRSSYPFDSAGTASFSSPRKSEERANGNSRFCKNLGKSRSAGALLAGVSSHPAAWKDDSQAQQNDGIQGAILHCKQSFKSCSEDRCVMSRSVSDTSHDKSNQRTE